MTQKEQIEKIAVSQADLSLAFSKFMNSQDLFNQRILDILENDVKTNRKGIVDKVQEIDERVSKIEIKHKITAGKITIGIFILTTIGSIVWKLISLLDI